MTTSLAIVNNPPTEPAPLVPIMAPAVQAASDEQLILLWLHGRSLRTQEVYLPEVQRFCRFVGVGLHEVTLAMVQMFADSLHNLQPATQRRILATIKSLFAFAHRLGYLPFDVTRPLRLPSLRETLNERILDEPDVVRIIACERNPRNIVLLTLLYSSGIRVSELCGLRWRDAQERENGGQITVYGKGGKTRTILLPLTVWEKIMSLQNHAREDEATVFQSRKRGQLTREQVYQIVRAATRRAGIAKNVSPHWLRHAHASHALEHGAPISLVQTTLGHANLATTSRYTHARPGHSSSEYILI